MTKIYAHRGSKGSYPENSMLAFQKAIEAGACGLEFDIHMAKCGTLVVIHDATLDRTTTGTGYVKDYSLMELQKFSVGAKFSEFKHYNPSWDAERIPTLSEVLTLCKAHDLLANVELKTYEIAYPGIEEAMLKVVKEVGYDPQKIVYSSFHLPTLLRIKKADKQAATAWLLENFIPMPHDYLKTFELEALHMDERLVLANPHYWQPVVQHLRVWTVNEKANMEKLIAMGVEAIITDYPEVAVELT